MTHIPCWIISLNPDADGPRALSQALTAQNITHSFVPAVDGRKGIPPLQGREYIDARKSLLRHQRLRSGSEIGCYLAHYRAIQRAYDSGLERICIIEDDVMPEPDFAAVLAALATQPAAIEMVRLMALRIRKRKVLGLLADTSHHLVRPERGWCGTQGYVLNRSGMQKVLDKGWSIYEPIDKFFDHFWEYDLRLYGVEPHVIYELPSPSSIKKQSDIPARIPLLLKLLAPLHKLAFSSSRHRYLKRHANEFYPTEWPEKRMGRTERMK
ncbi:MAG: glycosyltransferase family 25 protein [Pseudomonadota bacterium]